MNILNKTFLKNTVLYADELNLLVDKINEIISNIPASSGGSNGGSESSNDDIEAVRQSLQSAIDALNLRINEINAALDGATWTLTDTLWTQLFKRTFEITDEDANTSLKIMNAIMTRMNLLDTNGNPAWTNDVTLLRNDIQNTGSLTLTPELFTVLLTLNKDDVASTVVGAINLSADGLLIDASKIELDGKVLTDAISLGDDTLTIGGSDGYGEIYFDVSGNSGSNNVGVSITNDRGLEIQCDENTSNKTGLVRIGNTNGLFGIYTTYKDGNSASTSGMGYTGVIGNMKFVNGICIGLNTI